MQIRKHLMERSSVQEFADSISRYIDASTGVIHVRTAEVLRCATELRKVLVANDCIHYEWDIATGMKQIRETEIAKINIEGDGDINFLSAFNKPWARVLSGINGTIHADEIGKMAVFTYISPDPWMDGVPLVRHLVEKYATVLPSHDVRCVIITRDAPLPDNLSEMVGTCRFDTPSYSELEGFYEGIIESVRDENILSPMSEEDVRRVCFAGAGLTRERFDTHLSSAIVNGVRNLDEDGLLTVDDLVAGVSVGKTEVVNTSDLLELYPEESMANVGGMDVLKQWIDKRKSCYSDEAVAFGIEPPKGIVFVGPPGTGKSLVSKAISKQLGVPLVRFDFGRVFNSLVGKSEERIREALRMVESMAPCVLFIDEIDKGLAGMGGSGGDSGTSARVFGTFLTWLNDTQAPVFTVVTANNVTHLPPELMRKGRFDQIFTSGLPDRTDLKAVFDIHMRKRGWSFDAYTADEQLECINRVVGFVPAEVEAVVKDALIDAFNEGAKEPTVAHILAAADNTVPLIKSHTMDMIATMLWCKENGVPASTYTILDASEEGEVASKQDDKVVVNIDKARSVRARRRTTRK